MLINESPETNVTNLQIDRIRDKILKEQYLRYQIVWKGQRVKGSYSQNPID